LGSAAATSSRSAAESSTKTHEQSAALTNRTASIQVLTVAHFRAQLEEPRDTSLTLEVNLNTFGYMHVLL
jgi:hypothetical protein